VNVIRLFLSAAPVRPRSLVADGGRNEPCQGQRADTPCQASGALLVRRQGEAARFTATASKSRINLIKLSSTPAKQP